MILEKTFGGISKNLKVFATMLWNFRDIFLKKILD